MFGLDLASIKTALAGAEIKRAAETRKTLMDFGREINARVAKRAFPLAEEELEQLVLDHLGRVMEPGRASTLLRASGSGVLRSFADQLEK